MAKNVLGDELIPCGKDPVTGFFRDGCCETGPSDLGTDTVCAIVTDEFLQFTKSKGNDLITPNHAYKFPGLKAGDRWCLCVSRWLEAYHSGLAPKIILASTHEKTLEYVDLDTLLAYHQTKDS